MKNYWKVLLIVVLMSVFALAGCSQGDNQVPTARIVSGPPGLTVNTLASTLSEYVKDSILLSVEPGSTNGNLMSVNAGEAEFGISMTSSVVPGYKGTHLYEDEEKMDNVRIIAPLWYHYMIPLATDKSIIDISDLEGKEITSGPPGGDAEPLAKLLLEYAGLSEDDYKITPFGFSEGAEALKNRQIDSVFSGAPYPNPIQEDLGKTVGGRYINVGKEYAEQLVEEWPGLYFVEFEVGAPGLDLDKPYYTAAYRPVLITNADVSEDLVYEMTKGLHENFERLGNAIGNMKTFPVEELTAEVGEVPYHEGAIRYYKEVGLME